MCRRISVSKECIMSLGKARLEISVCRFPKSFTSPHDQTRGGLQPRACELAESTRAAKFDKKKRHRKWYVANLASKKWRNRCFNLEREFVAKLRDSNGYSLFDSKTVRLRSTWMLFSCAQLVQYAAKWETLWERDWKCPELNNSRLASVDSVCVFDLQLIRVFAKSWWQ